MQDSDFYKKDEKDVVLFQLENIGRVIANIENPNREYEKFSSYLDRVLLSLYWLEALSEPFLDDEFKRQLEKIEESVGNNVKSKIKMIRKFSKLIIKQINQKNLYFAKYKGFLLKADGVELEKETKYDVGQLGSK